MLRSLSISLLLIAGACGGSDKPTTTTPPANETPADQTATDQGEPAPCEAPVDGPMTPDQCTCQGGTVHGDPFRSEDVFRRHVATYAAVGVRSFFFNIPRGPITPTMRAISERVIPELRAGYATIQACGHQ